MNSLKYFQANAKNYRLAEQIKMVNDGMDLISKENEVLGKQIDDLEERIIEVEKSAHEIERVNGCDSKKLSKQSKVFCNGLLF